MKRSTHVFARVQRRAGHPAEDARADRADARAPAWWSPTRCAAMRDGVAPGVSHRRSRRDRRARSSATPARVPSFKGYHGFPASICASVNEQVVHAIPSADAGAARGRPDLDRLRRDPRRLARRRRDHGRRSATSTRRCCGWPRSPRTRCGPASPPPPGARAQRQGPAHRHLARGRDRGPQGAAGTASSTATAGTASAPRCTRTRTCSTTAGPARARGWCPGMALAIEPMITMGSPRTVELADGWTVVTRDGSVAAHVEHTMALLADGVWVLTALDGGRARLGDLVTARQPAPPEPSCTPPPLIMKLSSRHGGGRRQRHDRPASGVGRTGATVASLPAWTGGTRCGPPTGPAAVADRLRVALDEGRLDLHEYDERLQRAYAARTYGDLDGSARPTCPPVDAGGAVAAGADRRPAVAGCGGELADRSAAQRHRHAGWLEVWAPYLRRGRHRGDHLGWSRLLSRELLYFWPVWVAGPVGRGAGGPTRRRTRSRGRRRAQAGRGAKRRATSDAGPPAAGVGPYGASRTDVVADATRSRAAPVG